MRILIIGTLDTKGSEIAYIRRLIEARGHTPLLMDTGIMPHDGAQADFPSDQLAEAGGTSLVELRRRADRSTAIDTMIAGVRTIIKEAHHQGLFDGVIGIGGGGGTSVATAGMRELPVGVPKVMVSTIVTGDVSPFVGTRDIVMMPSVVDIAGLNRISRRILSNAVGAICGMVEQEVPQEQEDKPIVAATMFGVTTPCVTVVREELEKNGYEVLVFHATGSGGRAMEDLIRDGYIDGVADVTTTEWCDEVVGGVLSSGPDRLSAAGEKGVPQVVSCGALDMVNFNALSTVPERFRGRNLYKHNPNVTLMRTTPEECEMIGRRIAEKLNRATGPAVLMLPLQGVSMIDADGQPFHDPEANKRLFSALKEYLNSTVEVVEMDCHINDPEFGRAIAGRLHSLLNN